MKGLDEEVQAQSGCYSEDIRLKAAAHQANKPSLPTVSVNCSPALLNDTDRLGLNIIGQRTDYIYS